MGGDYRVVAIVSAARERGLAIDFPVAPEEEHGYGLNDAAALAVADVGIAMGARGASASSEAADAVVVTDRFDHVADAVEIARRPRSIAVQSIGAGMALSGVAMIFAALGYLPPVLGALVQEAIDVATILNALRALWDPVDREAARQPSLVSG